MAKLILWRCIFWGLVLGLVYGVVCCVGERNLGGLGACALGGYLLVFIACTATPGELF